MKKRKFQRGFKLIRWLPEEKYVLPDCYDLDRMVLLVKDPYWLYAYWDLSTDTQEKAKDYLKNLVLRVYDVTDVIFDGTNAHYHWEIDIHTFTDNWYIPIKSTNRNYLAELGFYNADGVFVTMLRSNSVLTPLDKLASILNQQIYWILGKGEDFLFSPRTSGEQQTLLEEMLAVVRQDEPATYTSGNLQGYWS